MLMAALLSVDFRFICPAKDIINADIIEVCQSQEGLCWRDPLAGFKFGKQRLLDAGVHLQGNLCVPSAGP